MIVKYIGEVVPGHLKSASALEVFNDYVYIAGDSLSWIYVFNKRFHLVDRIPISNHFSFEPLAKSIKPDWEGMSILTANGKEPQLLIAGSGSVKVKRDHAVLLNLHTRNVTNINHWPAFYNILRGKLGAGDELNIEGLAQVKNKLLLLNRGSTATKNYIFVTNAEIGWELIEDTHVIHSAPLDIKKTKAGFTGAYYIEEIDILLYSAAAEDTANAYDDGVVVGSALGYFNSISTRLGDTELVPDGQLLFDDIGISGKVESIALLRKKGNQYVFLAVTDNDGRPGSLYKFILEF